MEFRSPAMPLCAETAWHFMATETNLTGSRFGTSVVEDQRSEWNLWRNYRSQWTCLSDSSGLVQTLSDSRKEKRTRFLYASAFSTSDLFGYVTIAEMSGLRTTQVPGWDMWRWRQGTELKVPLLDGKMVTKGDCLKWDSIIERLPAWWMPAPKSHTLCGTRLM